MHRPAEGATPPLRPVELLLNEHAARLVHHLQMKKRKNGREEPIQPRRGIAVVVKVKDNPGRDGLRLVRWRNLPPGTGSLSHQQLLLGHRSSCFLHSRR